MTDGCETPAAGLSQCWNCKGPVAARALFCSTCGAVQPPGEADHFTRLGLPAGFALTPEDLDRQYFGFQRRLHPDRFASRPAKERALSQQQAMALNDAYETLRDPDRRAAYLLRLAGRDIEGAMADPALLGEVMELQEALVDADDAPSVGAILAGIEKDIVAARERIGEAFAVADLDGAAGLATRLRYFSRLADEARAAKIRLTRQGV